MEKVSTYADSSFLVSLLCQDANSNKAITYMATHSEPLLFTPLHRLEVHNALRNAEARSWINSQEMRAAFRQLEEDLKDGLLIHAPVDWTDACRCADKLSEKHTSGNGQRTIDLLHVAIALESKAEIFLTFDQRQGKLAAAVGMEVNI